jgi:hypothetical protein
MKPTLPLLTALLLTPHAWLQATDEQPFAPMVELSRERVTADSPTYVPAQTFSAFPDRMLPSYRGFLEGIKERPNNGVRPYPLAGVTSIASFRRI